MQPQIATATPVRRLSANRQLQLLQLANWLWFKLACMPRLTQPGPVGDIMARRRDRYAHLRERVMARLVALS